MTWTWDQDDITFDQTCWTFDGYNGCLVVGGWYSGTGKRYQAAYEALTRRAVKAREQVVREAVPKREAAAVREVAAEVLEVERLEGRPAPYLAMRLLQKRLSALESRLEARQLAEDLERARLERLAALEAEEFDIVFAIIVIAS